MVMVMIGNKTGYLTSIKRNAIVNFRFQVSRKRIKLYPRNYLSLSKFDWLFFQPSEQIIL